MADLGAIEIPIVTKERGLKESLRTITRLEGEIRRAVKAANDQTISQTRLNAVLLNAKREYQALGVSSQRATSEVRKYAAQQAVAMTRTISTTKSINNQSAAFTRQASAVNTFNKSQMAATKGNNQFGVVAQQTGYQVGDFLVQIQSGTNPMVAFGQQATQLVGVLPLMAGALGITTAAAIGLSTALGIGIPLLTAIGAYLMRASATSKKAAEEVDALEDSIKSLDKTLRDYLLTKKAAQLGITKEELISGDALKEAEKALATATENLLKFQEAREAIANAPTFEGAAVNFLTDLFTDPEGELKAAVDAAVLARERLANLQQQQSEERLKNFDNERVALQDQLAMAQEIAKFGEDSNRVAKLALEQRIAAFDRRIDQEVTANRYSVTQGIELKRINAELARSESSYETIEDKVKRISREIEAAKQFKLSTVFETASRAIDGMNSRLGVTLSQLGGIMSSINSVLIDTVAVQAESEALAAGKSATEAANAARIAREITTLTGTGNAEDLTLAQAAAITALTEALERNGVASDKLKAQQDALRDAAKSSKKEIKDLQKEIDKLNETAAAGLTPFDKYNKALKNLDVLHAKGLSNAAYSMEIERLNDELAKSLPMVNDVADAFGDFLARGMTDFKSFANSIFKSFQNMLAQMIATAARNKILISMGATGSAAGTAASAGVSSAIGSSIGTLASGAVSVGSNLAAAGTTALGMGGAFTGSFGAGMGATMTGGLAGGASAFGTGVGMMGTAGSAMSGFAMAAGAALPVIAAVALAVSFFRSKTKELDSGLNVTIDNMDVLVESFKTVEKSKFWGLSKRVTSTLEEASSTISDPIVSAVGQIQQSVLEAAEALGFGADVFDKFSYQFKLSLKGLSEDQQMQKINEELTKMGDSFASLTGIFSTMDELLAVAQQRFELEGRLLEVQGDVVELRKRELDTVHVLNKGLAARIQLLQAEADLQGSLGAFASAISQQQGLIRSAVDALVKPLQDAIEKTKTQAEKSYSIFRAAADKTRGEAQNIVDIITGALSSRNIQSEAVELLRYRQSQQQLASFAGGASFNESSLRKATEGVSIDSTKFFGSFEDYARDFYKTQISLTKLADKAQGELTDVEKQIDIADKAYQVAMGTYTEAQDFNVALDQLLTDLAVYTETAARNQPFIDQIKAEGDRQVELLEQILIETTKQINGLLGIENTIADLVGTNVSVGEALSILGLEGKDLAGAVIALQPVVDAVGSHVAALDLTLSGTIDRLGLSVDELSGLDLSGPLGDTILGLGDKFSALDLTTAGLSLGIIGLDGTIGILQSSINSQAETILQLDGTIIKQSVVVDALSGQVTALSSNVVNLDGTVFGLGTNVVGLGTNISDLGMNTNSLGININDLGATLSNAMSGLGSIVSGLSGAVAGLAASNNALASAQQAQTAAEAAALQAKSDAQNAAAAFNAARDAVYDYQLVKEGKYWVQRYADGEFFKTGHRNQELATKSAKANADMRAGQITLQAFADGGMHSGGMRLVGEQGPELEVTGPSRIYSAQQTKSMISGDSSETVAELRSLRQELSEFKAEQRKIGVENVKYNKKSYDLNREWDIVGLPATRTA